MTTFALQGSESFQALLNEEKIQAYSLLLNIESDVSALPETKYELIGLAKTLIVVELSLIRPLWLPS